MIQSGIVKILGFEYILCMKRALVLYVTIVVKEKPTPPKPKPVPIPVPAPKSTKGRHPSTLIRDPVSGGTFSTLDRRGMGRDPQAGLNSMLGVRWGTYGDRGI